MCWTGSNMFRIFFTWILFGKCKRLFLDKDPETKNFQEKLIRVKERKLEQFSVTNPDPKS